MNLLEHLKMSLLNFNYVMIYIIYKMLVLLKNHLNYLKNNIFECFFKEYNRLAQHIMMESLSLEEEKIIKDIRNLFRLQKETKAIKDVILRDIKNLFEHDEEENYYKPAELVFVGVTIILNMKVMVMEIKHYQLKNILTKLHYI